MILHNGMLHWLVPLVLWTVQNGVLGARLKFTHQLITEETADGLLHADDRSSPPQVDGKSLKDLTRIFDQFSISGVLRKPVSVHTDKEDKGQRRWWVVKFQEGCSLLIKMWNGEIDVKKNHRFFQSNVPKTILCSWSEDIKYNLENARFRITDWSALQLATRAGQNLSLTFKMSSADPPRHGSCWRSAAKTMKRAVKGWTGVYSQKNLDMKDEDADENDATVVKGAQGAQMLNVVLLMYPLLRDLEHLYNERLLRASVSDIAELERTVAAKFLAVNKEIGKLRDEKLQTKLRELLDAWQASVTQEGEQQATLNEIKNMPTEGTAVRLTSQEIVRVEQIRPKMDQGSLRFNVTVRSLQGVFSNMTQETWEQSVAGFVNSEQYFGIRAGSQGIRYGMPFRVLEDPVASRESPIEKSLWANAQKIGEDAAYGHRVLVRSACAGHPAVGKMLSVKGLPGKYKVESVDVVDEVKKVAKLRAIKIESGTEVADSIFTVWDKASLLKIAKNKQLLLDANDLHLRVTGVEGVHLRTEKVGFTGSPEIGIVEAKDKAHIAVVAQRISRLLVLALTEVWSPNYLRDDRAKLIRKRIEIGAKVATGLIVAGLAVTGIGMAVVGVPVLFGAGLGAAWTTISGTVFFSLYTNVFLNLLNLTPAGLPNMIYQYVNRKYLASIMVRSNLAYAEKVGASSTATTFCPLGSHAEASDVHAMCNRQKLRMRNKAERDGALKALEEKSGDKLSDPWYTSMYKNMKFWESMSPAEEAKNSVDISIYLMTELAQTLAAVSDMECEAVPESSLDQKYRLRERWTLMPRPADVTYKSSKRSMTIGSRR